MRLHLLGTGTPTFDEQRPFTTAILLETDSQRLLFDAGRGVTAQLLKQGIDPTTIDTLFITHHHYDHICDLGEFLLSSWHNGRTHPIQVFGPQGTAGIVDALFNQVYARDIAFALFNEPEVVDIRQLVQVVDVGPGLVAEGADWYVLAEYVNHGHSLGLSQAEWPCLGYRWQGQGKVVAIGGDTVACAGLDKLAKNADVLILSCHLAQQEIDNEGFARLAQYVIASSGQVGKIASQAGVQKLVLTHFRRKSAELMHSIVQDVQADFAGELYIGEDLMIIEI